jgi:hypothetical protein
LDATLSDYENISYSQISDGLNRWPGHPIDPNRRAALCVAIRTGLRSSDLESFIMQNVEAVREKLQEEAELIAAGYPAEPPPILLPPLPEPPPTTVVQTKYNPLRH